ncbi:MAG: sulfotransferase [Leptolyngbyaceae cyanobacterium MO_188.B28]|nr:sulfotransferase [Leptolyngbyaceae cyanobacterium MO_188.B28]
MTPIRRCGSHALRLRLNFSPDFYSPYPLHIVDFMPLLPFYGDLSNDFNYFQLVIDLVGLQNATMVKWENVALDPVAVFNRIQDKPRNIHVIAWEMLFLAGQRHNAKVVMDKSLDNVHYAEELISLFDDILFLNVVRDPRAQISSINRAIIHDFDILLNTLTWRKAHDIGRALAQKYPDRVLTIRYEDFIDSQEAVLRKICQFFDIPFLGAMLDVSLSNEAKDLSVLSALWESNTSAPIPANVDKFKKMLSLEDIQLIETLTAEHMDYYGYERMTKDSTIITDSMVETAKQKSQSNKRKAWQDLKRKNPLDYQLRKFRADYLSALYQRLTQQAA